ncbi:MAG: hypothetical protein NTZ58_03865, partial [Solirubrobacterales bacterium]|nr:hypothetical protein [Solirubrobacterales bacterium]
MNDRRHSLAGRHVVAGRRCRRRCDQEAVLEERQVIRRKGVTAAHGTGRPLAAVGRGGGPRLALAPSSEKDEDAEY